VILDGSANVIEKRFSKTQNQEKVIQVATFNNGHYFGQNSLGKFIFTASTAVHSRSRYSVISVGDCVLSLPSFINFI
jgi:hypothetical protein